MESKLKCGTCRRGILFPTSTAVYGCCKCQRIICARPNEQAKINCSGCGGQFIVPIKTTAYQCSICQAVTPTTGHGQWIPGSSIPGQKLKLGSILFKHNQFDRSHQSSSSSTGSSFSSSSRCNKRALLCGVTYKKRRYKLKGSMNDVMNMREMLVKIFDFPKESIRILTEEEKDRHLVPTKKNILESLRWLVKGCQPGDSLVFYFSGHGLQQADLKEDELDGFDETLCPVDFLQEGMIIDNDLNSILVWPLKNGVTLHAIVDACHSGTILDLAYVYKRDNHKWEDNKPPAKVPMRKHTSGGLAISFSACEDSQIAIDTSVFRKGVQGVMTHLFIKAIKENPNITYGGILEKVQEGIAIINQKSCHPRIFRCSRRHNIAQHTKGKQTMAESKERCSHCGRLLIVTPEAHAFKCGVCHSITRIGQASNALSLVYNSVSHAANKLRGFLNNVITGSFNSNVGYGTPNYGYYPQPQLLRPPAPLVPASAYGSKRALLCGICYHGRSYRLKGSLNDVKFMRYFLINQFGFPGDSILMLTDDNEEKNRLKIPTKKNMQTAMRWLVEGCRPGDSLVFHFSGHGTQEVDHNMDEIDGYDEALLPVDYEINGMILDDEINATIVRPLPRGSKLHAIIDACHSGTILDLPFVCKMSREGFYTWEDHTQPMADYKGTRGGLAICISACDDAGSSVDTSAFGGKVVTGALTYSLIQAVQNEPGLTYSCLLGAIRAAIRGAKVGIVALNGPIISLLNKMLGMDHIRQDAQLSSSEKFDIHIQRFVL